MTSSTPPKLSDGGEWIHTSPPTHRCVKCGALWAFFEPGNGIPHASWSVRSPNFGQCCDRATGQLMDLIMIPLDADPL